MVDEPTAPQAQEQEEELAPFKIEKARSGRSKCKTCRRAITKDSVRFGVLVDGRFGQGYMWHHINCAAKRRLDEVEEAYELKCFVGDVEPPDLEKLRKLAETAEKKKEERKEIPYTEMAPTGRSKCKSCEKLIEKGSHRVILLRNVEFYGQVRSGPINVHPSCVRGELEKEDCATEADGFGASLRQNSTDVPAEQIDQVLAEIGDVG